ncbi:MAG: 50S ribosomal protein L17 [candidate division Zixibacteria bacterium]|nr:50S ribosomal protein L17 [candidate division Zixibacteria bacterium]
MRHRRSVRKLGVKTAHRKAMMSNMASSLIEHGQIQTTVARAKVLVPVVSRLITFAKRGDVHARRMAAITIKNRNILKKLFNDIAPEFENKNGGYARVIRNGFRKGDGASMAVVELLIEKKGETKETKKGKADKDKEK